MPTKKTKLCLECEVGLTIDKYCSNQCQRDHEWRARKEEIEATGRFLPTENSRTPKRYLKEKYGSICSICSMDLWFGNEMPLVLDHIDGDSTNWLVENFRLICPNCDTFTPFYKGRNRGRGRHIRRERFRAGKSF